MAVASLIIFFHSLSHSLSDLPPATIWVSGPVLGTPRPCHEAQSVVVGQSDRYRLRASLEKPGWTHLFVTWESGGFVHTILSCHLLRSFHCPLSFCFHIPLSLSSLYPHPSWEAGERRRPLGTGAYGSGNCGHHPGV